MYPAISSVANGSTQAQPNRIISVPATITATDPKASATLCKKAARMFTLDFDARKVNAAVPRSTSKAMPATITTIQPATDSGLAKRIAAS